MLWCVPAAAEGGADWPRERLGDQPPRVSRTPRGRASRERFMRHFAKQSSEAVARAARERSEQEREWHRRNAMAPTCLHVR